MHRKYFILVSPSVCCSSLSLSTGSLDTITHMQRKPDLMLSLHNSLTCTHRLTLTIRENKTKNKTILGKPGKYSGVRNDRTPGGESSYVKPQFMYIYVHIQHDMALFFSAHTHTTFPSHTYMHIMDGMLYSWHRDSWHSPGGYTEIRSRCFLRWYGSGRQVLLNNSH